jgi:hypothetical protein
VTGGSKKSLPDWVIPDGEVCPSQKWNWNGRVIYSRQVLVGGPP